MSINAWGSDDPAEVAKGGTGNSTLTDHGVLLGSGTSPVTVTAAPTNGQLLIGSTGADPSLAVPTGDANEIAITTGAGSLAIGIADNPVLPGNESVTIPVGTTAQEPAAGDGKMRYDSDTDKLRASINGTWVDIATGGGGSYTYITTTTVSSSTSNIVFDNTVIATYKHFVFYLVATPTSANALRLRVSNNNGSTFHSSGYKSGGGRSGTFNTTTTFLQTDLSGSNIGSSAPAICGVGTLLFPLDASRHTEWVWHGAIDSSIVCSASGFYATAEANDAVEFAMVSADIALAQIDVYGIAAS